MTRRITCFIVFVTLIWGAHTEHEEKVRDMFKSNMTRNDFSNLLQSLINLNEQRVSVLQKLYRLEDYGVLSEVLRSGDKKTGNGNPNNLFLIVMSKNENDPSRRKMGFQVEDSVTSLNAGNNNIQPKLDFVLDPASFISQNIGKEKRLESIFRNVPGVIIPTKLHRANDRSKKNTTTTKTLKYNKLGLGAGVKLDSNVLRAVKTSLKANENRKHNKENSRYEIISNKGRHTNASKKLLDNDGKSNKYPQTVGYNSRSNEYLDIDFTIENDKLTTKPVIIEHILSSNHKHSKYPIEGKGEQDENDYGSPFGNIKNDRNREYTKMISDISVKKHQGNNHKNPKTNKYILKVKNQNKQQNGNLSTKPIIIEGISGNHQNPKYSLEGKGKQDENDYGSPFSNIKNYLIRQYTNIISDISVKKHHGNDHHNHKTNKYTPKVKVQSNQQNGKLTIKPIIIKDISGNHQNAKNPLENNGEQDENDYGSPFSNIQNYHNSQYNKKKSDVSIKNLHVNNHHNPNTNKNIPKVEVQRNQQNDKLSTKQIVIKDIIKSNHQNTKYPIEVKDKEDENYYGLPFSDSENDYNNPKINNTLKIEFQSNQHHTLNENKSSLNNQGNRYSKPKLQTAIETNTRTVNNDTASENNHSIKTPNINNDNANVNNRDLIYTTIKHKDATKEMDNNKFLTLASENVYGKPVILETTKATQYESYPGFVDHKDVTDNSNKDKPKTGINTPYGSYSGLEHPKDVRDNSNKDKIKTTIRTPFGNFHGFEHHKNVMDNLNKDKPDTAKELHYGDNLNAESKKDIDYYGVKMFDDGKKSIETFSMFITNVENGTADEVKQQNDPKLILKALDQPESKPIARKPFAKCLNKKAIKLCCKSCISAYKNVCQRLKCTSRSKKALKKECKRSCKKTFASSSSKYSREKRAYNSDEDSNESSSDNSS